MVLITHILFALVSSALALYTAISPSKNKLYITYFLTVGTVVSGAVLTVLNSQLLGKTCVTGILYLGFIIITSRIAKKRLVALYD